MSAPRQNGSGGQAHRSESEPAPNDQGHREMQVSDQASDHAEAQQVSPGLRYFELQTADPHLLQSGIQPNGANADHSPSWAVEPSGLNPSHPGGPTAGSAPYHDRMQRSDLWHARQRLSAANHGRAHAGFQSAGDAGTQNAVAFAEGVALLDHAEGATLSLPFPCPGELR
jgi:hypothetical protein